MNRNTIYQPFGPVVEIVGYREVAGSIRTISLSAASNESASNQVDPASKQSVGSSSYSGSHSRRLSSHRQKE